MDNETTGLIIEARRNALSAINGLNDMDKNNSVYYRVGWAESCLKSSLKCLDEVLKEHDAMMYEMDARADNLTDKEGIAHG